MEIPKDSIEEEGRQATDDAVDIKEGDLALTPEGEDGVKEEVAQPLSALPDLASLFAQEASEAPEAVAADDTADHELDTL
ncbi:hypothetical protein FOZ63_020523 [Perkinsus olseni]|uniref:Uncharacterized protein n=1 Tax=Perkinsus olseni TaxID=32597 RepID=A0A7J6U5H5_PEROL|nr:hypothetical protein FOZ63_020523 [Perkinsus olseni]